MNQALPRKIKTNWILEYSDAMAKVSEAPHAYNVWCAISVIGAVLKKKVWVQRGVYKVFPNQYIVLVGPPGVGKGTAINPAHAFAKNNVPELANYIPDRISAEKIIVRLHNGFPTTIIRNGLPLLTTESSAVMMATELQVFLGASDWMLPFLCDLWDSKTFEYDTKHKGSYIIKDPGISLMGACVPNFIRSLNKDEGNAINGGFTARAIFVFAGEKSQSLVWPMTMEDHPKTKQVALDLAEDIKAIANLSGEFTFTPEARILFERFYNDVKISDEDSEVVKHFKGRQNVHVIKTAMCLSAGKNNSVEIDAWCMKTAIALIQQILDSLDITFRGVGESPLAEATAKIQSYLERKGMATKGEILKANQRHITSEDLDRVLLLLCSIEFCEIINMSNRSYYKHVNQNRGTAGSVSKII